MMEISEYTVDRVEGDFAVCVKDGETLDARIGEHSVREGDTVRLTESGGEYTVPEIISHADCGAHAERAARLRGLFRK